MGVQAGYGNSNYKLFQIKLCYNDDTNAIYPNVIGTPINDSCHETWADGIQIFHNPFAEIQLDPAAFPHAGHHFYVDGLIRSEIPHNHIISTTTYNIKNLPIDPPSLTIKSDDKFDEIVNKWRMN
jgi:hypothetical protein